MSKVTGLKCKECGETYKTEGIHVCDLCFGPLEVSLDYNYIRSIISREKIENGPLSLWRYADLLPVDSGWDPNVRVGFTPLQLAPRLGAAIGIDTLYVKNDSVNPTYSFKDRPVAIAVTKARELGHKVFACASTGNLASAVAAAGMKAGLETYVFLPADVETGKITNAAVYGANLIAVNGTYDQLNRLCSEIADETDWAFCNINVRPYYAEGSKTLAYETVEQLGWQAPDHVVVPIASGALYTKIAQGFQEMVDVDLLLEQNVRISGAQPDGCCPVATAFAKDESFFEPVRQPDTIAKSLAIGNPADGNYALEVARRTNGVIQSVSNSEIVEGIQLLATTEGIFTEAAGGVTIATLKKLAKAGIIGENEVTVAYVTGNGLKTQEAVDGHVSVTATINPTIGSFEDALEDKTQADLALSGSQRSIG